MTKLSGIRTGSTFSSSTQSLGPGNITIIPSHPRPVENDLRDFPVAKKNMKSKSRSRSVPPKPKVHREVIEHSDIKPNQQRYFYQEKTVQESRHGRSPARRKIESQQQNRAVLKKMSRLSDFMSRSVIQNQLAIV